MAVIGEADSVKRNGENCKKSSPTALIIITVSIDISNYSLVVLEMKAITYSAQLELVKFHQQFVFFNHSCLLKCRNLSNPEQNAIKDFSSDNPPESALLGSGVATAKKYKV